MRTIPSRLPTSLQFQRRIGESTPKVQSISGISSGDFSDTGFAGCETAVHKLYPAGLALLTTNLVWRAHVQEARLYTHEHNHIDNTFKLELMIWLPRKSVLNDRLGRTSRFLFENGDLHKSVIGAGRWQREE